MIIVTGAAGGLGLPLLENLADCDEVIGIYHRSVPNISRASAIELYQVDVTDENSIRSFVQEIGHRAKRVTLVNLAGVASSRLAVDVDAAEWDRVVDVSLKGSFLMSRALLRGMIRERWGRIVNISSIVADEGTPGTAAYSAAKAGLHGLTRTLAKEYSRYGILVNTLLLGYFDRGMSEKLSEEQRRVVLAKIPLRRFGDVSEISEAVRYLIRAEYVTGTTLSITGGLP